MSDAAITATDWEPPTNYLPPEGSGADLSSIGASDRTAQVQLPSSDYILDKGSDFLREGFNAVADAFNTSEDEYNTRLDQQFGVTAQQDPYNAPIDPAEWQKKYPDLGIQFTPDMSAPVAQILVDKAQTDARRNFIVAHSPQDLISRAGRFATDAAVQLTDPLNVAAAFVPGVGEVRAGLWAERFGPMAARMMEGAPAGATGSLALQPLDYAEAKTYQQQYGPMEAFMNVAFGTALGGGLHAGFGGMSDWLSRLSDETREAALRGAVAQAAEGRSVDIEPILASDPAAASSNDVLNDFGLRSASQGGVSSNDLGAALADVQFARGGIPADAKSASLFKTIREMGGLRLKDETGAAHDDGDFRSILQDTPNFGLIENRKGMYPDQMRQALEERGWFGNRENNSSSIGDLGDLLDQEARATGPTDKVYHPESNTFAHMRYQAQTARDLDDAGVLSSDSNEQAAVKLAKYRNGAMQSHLAWLRAGADEQGVKHDETTTHEQLLADMMERDASGDPNGNDETMTDAHEAELDGYLAARFGRTTNEDNIDERFGQDQDFGGETSEAQGNARGGKNTEGQAGAEAFDPRARIGGRSTQEVIGAARESAMRFAEGREASPIEASPEVSDRVQRDVRAHLGDDIQTELRDAYETVRKYRAQGIVTDEEMAALTAANETDTESAQTYSDAASAAARCLFLHP